MVSIRLVMNGGIIDKADKGTHAYSEEEVKEQMALAYSEYQMAKYANETEKTPEQFIEERLGNTFSNVENVSITNGVINATIDGKTYQSEHISGANNNDSINYGAKTKETISVGDDITIGTERFKVARKTSNKIYAIPYYNIELKTDNPKQSASSQSSVFATEQYWEGHDGSDISMDNEKNLIQRYITAYKNTLSALGAPNVTVRVINYSDVSEIDESLLNPGNTGIYWLGTSASIDCIFDVDEDGFIDQLSFDGDNGVRPIIEINI